VLILSISLDESHILNSLFTVKMNNGDLSATELTKDFFPPISSIAGKMYFFTIDAKDLFDSDVATGGQQNEIEIIASFAGDSLFPSLFDVAESTNLEHSVIKWQE
jgi:hypothetical protein